MKAQEGRVTLGSTPEYSIRKIKMYRKIEEEELRVSKDTGYVYFTDKEHPLATGNSYRVYFHRHVASIQEGTWLPSHLHVHHINGNKLDNSISNLEILTNSEHAQKHFGSLGTEKCNSCAIEFSKKYKEHKYCSLLCSSRASRTKHPDLTKEVLDALIPTNSWVALGALFGMSDNGIRKRAKALGCLIPIRNKRG